jgi:hypothetical protein
LFRCRYTFVEKTYVWCTIVEQTLHERGIFTIYFTTLEPVLRPCCWRCKKLQRNQ